jgi:O-antigen/teichoic acid export membrane protein
MSIALKKVYKLFIIKYWSLIKEGGLYTFINVLDRVVPFILLPIILRSISVEEFGIYSIFLSAESFLVPIVTLNIFTSISKEFYDDGVNLKKYNSSIILSLPFLFIIFALILLIIPERLIELFGLESNIILFAIFTACFSSSLVYTSSLLRLKRQPIAYGKYYLSQSSLLLLLLLLFVFIYPSYKMLVYAKLVYAIFVFAISIIFLRIKDEFNFGIDLLVVKKALKISFPTVIYSLSAFIFVMSDRFLINHFLGPKEVGYYAAISQVAAIMSVIVGSFNVAWMPWLFENLKKNDKKTNLFIVKTSYYLMALVLLGGILFCFIYPFVVKIFLVESFFPYISVAYPIIIGLAFQGVYLIVSPYTFYAGKTKYNAIIGILVALINVSLNLYLIPKYGIWGAGYAYLASWFSLSVLFFIFSRKAYPMPWFSE